MQDLLIYPVSIIFHAILCYSIIDQCWIPYYYYYEFHYCCLLTAFLDQHQVNYWRLNWLI